MPEVLNRSDVQFDAVLEIKEITLQGSAPPSPSDSPVQPPGSPVQLSTDQTGQLLQTLEKDHLDIARSTQEEIARAFGAGAAIRVSLAFREGSILVAGTAILLFAGKVVVEAALGEVVKTAIQRALDQWFKGPTATNILQRPVTINLNFTRFMTSTSLANANQRASQQRQWSGSYPAALIMFAPVVSILAVILTAGVIYYASTYLSSRGPATPTIAGSPVPDFFTVFAIGMLAPIAVWLVGARFYMAHTTFAVASQHQRGELEEWRCEFAKHGFPIDGLGYLGADAGDQPYPSTTGDAAVQDVKAACSAFDQALHAQGIVWMTRRGYLTLQDYRHKAEEALIEFEPEPAVVMDAVDAHLRLTGSTINTKSTLEGYLKTALPLLGDEAKDYLACLDPSLASSSNSQRAGTPPAAPGVVPSSSPTAQQKIQARAIIREVVHTINRYRSLRFAGLVSARSQLLAAAVLVGATTYVLLAFAILWKAHDVRGLWQDLLLSTMVLYLVGAGAGLFYRLYDESKVDRAVDDLGLSLARLITAPLFSGLAAVAGVVFYNIVVNFPAGQAPTGVPPADFLDLAKHPIDVLVAAFFGLTPNLLINYVQQQTSKYIGELNSTEQSSTGD